MPEWQARKWKKRAECLIFIVNNVFGPLQYQMKSSTYLVDDSDLEDETNKDELEVTGVYDIVGSDINK